MYATIFKSSRGCLLGFLPATQTRHAGGAAANLHAQVLLLDHCTCMCFFASVFCLLPVLFVTGAATGRIGKGTCVCVCEGARDGHGLAS